MQPPATRLRPSDDLDLVRAILSGERAACDLLYDRFFERVHAYVWRRVASATAVELVTEQAFLRLVDALPRYDGRVPLAALVLRETRRALAADSGARPPGCGGGAPGAPGTALGRDLFESLE